MCRFSFRRRGTARKKERSEENSLFHITLAGVLFAVETKYCCALTIIKLKRKGAAEATPYQRCYPASGLESEPQAESDSPEAEETEAEPQEAEEPEAESEPRQKADETEDGDDPDQEESESEEAPATTQDGHRG